MVRYEGREESVGVCLCINRPALLKCRFVMVLYNDSVVAFMVCHLSHCANIGDDSDGDVVWALVEVEDTVSDSYITGRCDLAALCGEECTLIAHKYQPRSTRC